MTDATATVAALPYSRTNPFPAKMLVNRRLSGLESEKDTRHFELDLTGWGLGLGVGDLLAVCQRINLVPGVELFGRLGATAMERFPGRKGGRPSLGEGWLANLGLTRQNQ